MDTKTNHFFFVKVECYARVKVNLGTECQNKLGNVVTLYRDVYVCLSPYSILS